MDGSTVVTICAIIAGPILAVQAQKVIERIRQKSEEKRRVFMTLMATRGRPLVLDHVQALNIIDVVFSGNNIKDRAVIEAWSELRDHFANYPPQPTEWAAREPTQSERASYESQTKSWASKKEDLLIQLLSKMADSLGYHFDNVLLKRGAYTPSDYGETEVSQLVIRRGLTEVFLGRRSIPVNIIGLPDSGEGKARQKED